MPAILNMAGMGGGTASMLRGVMPVNSVNVLGSAMLPYRSWLRAVLFIGTPPVISPTQAAKRANNNGTGMIGTGGRSNHARECITI